jgi:transposase
VFEQVTDRWHTGFVDLTGEQGLLGQVEGRSSSDAGSWGWLAARTQHWRDGVATVAIDMCSANRATVRKHLPHATLVVDHSTSYN